uniref:Uncharacterized protein n=1 Tax=Malurus cyaneus samueli TaxID=2593467 RepID=A0A8C5UCX3_9PASS
VTSQSWVNGKRPPLLLQQISAPEECYTLAHEENVRFVYEGEGRESLGQCLWELEHVERLPSTYTRQGTSGRGCWHCPGSPGNGPGPEAATAPGAFVQHFQKCTGWDCWGAWAGPRAGLGDPCGSLPAQDIL